MKKKIFDLFSSKEKEKHISEEKKLKVDEEEGNVTSKAREKYLFE